MPKKKYTQFRPRVRSRHPSHKILKEEKVLNLFPKRSVVRLGSSTEYPDTVSKGGTRVEVNTVEAVKNSANKLRMKRRFAEHNVPTADWWVYDEGLMKPPSGESITPSSLPYPIISKNVYGSRGNGNVKHNDEISLVKFLSSRVASGSINNYIFERYINYTREYRLHVTKDGCFYTCRKMLKRDTPDKEKWFRNDKNCVWILETNEAFDKPVNWDSIVKASVDALKSVGLDIGAVDLRVQSATSSKGKKRKEPKFFIVEINSAPSFGEITEEKYIEQINKLVKELTVTT
jgi:glutathione synthase/RimK-type ligase-like ATP-grasp enzyme